MTQVGWNSLVGAVNQWKFKQKKRHLVFKLVSTQHMIYWSSNDSSSWNSCFTQNLQIADIHFGVRTVSGWYAVDGSVVKVSDTACYFWSISLERERDPGAWNGWAWMLINEREVATIQSQEKRESGKFVGPWNKFHLFICNHSLFFNVKNWTIRAPNGAFKRDGWLLPYLDYIGFL